MKEMPDNSVDSIVTDPPYELGFMGKSWDSTGIAFNVEVWQQALRVLKPGGHLIAFSGSRTYHRMAVAIEDAGFEIRDQIMWVYGSGFPKSHNVSKGIDKRGGATADFTVFRDAVKNKMKQNGVTIKQLTEALGNFMTSHYLTAGSQPAIPNYRDYKIIRETVKLGNEFDHLFAEEAEREVIGTKMSGIANAEEGQRYTIGASKAIEVDITAPATAEAKQWQGWGTALKPAHEPMVLARKPVIGTVANNVLTWGVGGLNIDGSRVVATGENFDNLKSRPIGKLNTRRNDESDEDFEQRVNESPEQLAALEKLKELGRWPANFIHDGSDEVLELFPDTKGKIGNTKYGSGTNTIYGKFSTEQKPNGSDGVSDSGSAARFFYCAKTSKRDRNEGLENIAPKFRAGLAGADREGVELDDVSERFRTQPAANNHPTVKPTDLMRYLVKLVTPTGGTVLDPFMGSGSTGKGAVIEGFDFIGIDQSAEYLEIAKARIAYVQS